MTGVAHRSLCECGQAERISKGKGCARCEHIDRVRYASARPAERVRWALNQFDEPITIAELAEASGLPTWQARYAIRHLIEAGEAEVNGAGWATEYRRRS